MPTNLSHFFMVKPNHYEKIKNVLNRFEIFEEISEDEFLNHLTTDLPIQSLLKIKEFYDTSKAVYEIPFVGLMIYQDKVVYANQYFQKLSGYSLEELKKMTPDKLVAKEHREKIKEIIQKRLKGEYFSQIYDELKLKTKSGSYRYAIIFSNTILYKEGHAGFVFVVDITKQKRYEKLYKALRNINKAITTILTEEELYKTVCETLVKELDIKFVWIGKPDENKRHFEKVYQCGKDEGYLDVITISTGSKYPEGKGPTGSAYREGKIFINADTKNNPVMKPWKEEMLKRGFLSSAAIPLKKKGKVAAVLNIYATEPYYFEEENKTLLEELERDLSFALEKIETIKDSMLLKNAVEKSSEWVIITDKNGNIEYVNDYVCELTGYTREELMGQNPRIFKSGYQPKEFYEKLWKTILSGKEFEAVFVNRKKNGEIFYIDERIIPVKLPHGELKFVSLGRDITQEIHLQEENERLRFFDILTNVYNFNGFAVKIDDYLIHNPEILSALIIIDIANFSYINKTYSVEIGDELLRNIAKVLKNYFKKDDIIGRIGGDEFGIFIKDLKQREDLYLIIERLKNILNRETIFKINGKNIGIHYHGGIAVYPDDGKNFKQLLQNASIALKDAKEEGINVIKLFNKNIEEKIKSRVLAEDLIQKAIRENLFVFHYQPYFDAKTKKLAGFEALIRIKDKNGKIHYPNEFIDLLEKSIFLDEFTNWALQEVSQKIIKWEKPISINISAKTFKDPNFPEEVFKYIKELPASFILEITERLYMDEPEKSEKIIERLKKCKNIKIAIDDFGTGYSSLSYLKDINADILKVDISFVRAMVEDKKAKAVVQAIITLAKSFGMKTLAEGVETETQYNMLKEMDVDYVQGFYFAKPLPEEEVEKLINLT